MGVPCYVYYIILKTSSAYQADVTGDPEAMGRLGLLSGF